MKPQSILALLSSASAAAASWAGNVNYRSPSALHPALGIAVHKVERRSDPGSAPDPSKLGFTHGVASGDPYHDSVILWTRAAPTVENDKSNVTVSHDAEEFMLDNDEFVKHSKHPICVEWKISEHEDLHSPAGKGTVYTSSDIDYTIKVRGVPGCTPPRVCLLFFC